ncbi:unnamed protein product, partial [Rotaria magnacalcarata]
MNNYSNQANRHKITANNTRNAYAIPSSNQTVDRARPLENADDCYYDQHSNIQFISRSNQHNRIPAPTSTNLLPLDSSSLIPCRRSRAQLEENDDFIPVTNRNKKRRNDNNNDDRSSYEQQQQQNGRPRYPTRFQNSQQQQEDLEKNDRLIASISVENHQDHQSLRQEHQPFRREHPPIQQEQTVSTAAARYALTRFPFSPFIIRFST